MGRPLGVVTVEVVVVVPAPARPRAVRGRVGAVVTGHVLVDVTGRGRLVVVVVTGRVRMDVTGWVVVVVAGAVPVPEIHRLVHIDGVGKVKILNLLIQLGSIDRSGYMTRFILL